MAILNQITPPSYYGDDKYKMALIYMDKLFQYFPDYDNFLLTNIISRNLKDKELRDGIELQHEIQKLLVDKFYYAERDGRTYRICLTNQGRKVKETGGHGEYLELEQKLEEKEKRLRELITPEQIDKVRDLLTNTYMSNDGFVIGKNSTPDSYPPKNPNSSYSNLTVSSKKGWAKRVTIFLGHFFQHTNNVVGTIGGILAILLTLGITLSKCS